MQNEKYKLAEQNAYDVVGVLKAQGRVSNLNSCYREALKRYCSKSREFNRQLHKKLTVLKEGN